MINFSQNLDELHQNGLIKVPKFLNLEQIKKVSSIILKYSAPKGSKKSYLSKNYKWILYKIIKFDLIGAYESLQILNLCNSLKLKNFAQKYFNKEVYISLIDAYYSKMSVNKDFPVIPWHTDQAYSGANLDKIKEFVNPDDCSLKFFVYLTDVYSNNGCMSYIPGSHKVTYIIRKGIYSKEIVYSPYWSIPQILNFVSNETNKKYRIKNLKDENFFYDFVKKIELIAKTNNDKIYDYSMKSGDAIIFDEGIIHKGSRLLHSDRMVLRFIFKPILN